LKTSATDFSIFLSFFSGLPVSVSVHTPCQITFFDCESNISTWSVPTGVRSTVVVARGDVIWLVMREVLLLVGIGVGIGLPAAIALTRLLQSQLYGITPNDPVTIAFATLGLAAIGAVSVYFPARRATLIDPVTALRYE
jgi:hypothetical protein